MTTGPEVADGRTSQWGLVIVAWALVATPLAWGVLMTFRKALLLFNH